MSSARNTEPVRSAGGRRRLWRCTRLWVAALLIGSGAGCGAESEVGATAPPSEPKDTAIGGTSTSMGGRYRVELRPAAPPIALGELHNWVIELERTDGAPAKPTSVSFAGGMPAHGHGFTTAPRVTRQLGAGGFLVEGVKFHMAGTWELRVLVTDLEGGDRASVEFTLDP